MSTNPISHNPSNAPMTFADRAALVTPYGVPVAPLKPRSKDPFLNDWQHLATTDETQIAKWAEQNPAYNCAAIARKGGVWILDIDDPSLPERIKTETGHSLDELDTLVVKSSGGKHHHYFKQDSRSEAMGNVSADENGKEIFSARVHNAYVVAAGSIHPDTGQPYEIVRDPVFCEIPTAPSWLMDWVESYSSPSERAKTQKIPENIPEGSRNKTLASLAGSMRNRGADESTVLAALQMMNLKQCHPPLEDSEVETIAKSISRYSTQAAFVQNPTQKAQPLIVSGTADQIKLKKIVWLWLNRFAQKFNLLVGNPDLGKGLIAYYVAAVATTGRDWFDGKNTLPPSEALIMSAEEDWEDTIAPRLVAAGADMSKVRWLKISVTKNSTKVERELQLDQDAAVLETFLIEHPGIRLVVIDPVSSYLGKAQMIDEQKIRGEILMPLKDIASRCNVTVIGIMHLNKKVELDAIHRIGGAMAFVGVARMVWLVAPKPAEDGTDSDEILMVKVKGNIVHRKINGLAYRTEARPVSIEGDEVMTPYVKWTGYVDATADQIAGKKPPAPAHRPAEQLQAAEKWLRDFLKNGAKPQKEIENQGINGHDLSKNTLRRAKAEIGILAFQKGRKWFWELPTGENPPVENTSGLLSI